MQGKAKLYSQENCHLVPLSIDRRRELREVNPSSNESISPASLWIIGLREFLFVPLPTGRETNQIDGFRLLICFVSKIVSRLNYSDIYSRWVPSIL